jgi:hypothetical protein
MKTVIARGRMLLCRNGRSLLNKPILIAVIDLDQRQNAAAEVRFGFMASGQRKVCFSPESRTWFHTIVMSALCQNRTSAQPTKGFAIHSL